MSDFERRDSYKTRYIELQRAKSRTDEELAELQRKYVQRGCEIDALNERLDETLKLVAAADKENAALENDVRALRQRCSKITAQRDALNFAIRAALFGIKEE